MAHAQQEIYRQRKKYRDRQTERVSECEREGGMQRCPYLHEMRERLLDQPRETLQLENMERANLLDNRQSASESHQVGTVVKVGAVGCTRTKDSSHMQYQALSSHFDSLHSFTPKFPIHLYKKTLPTQRLRMPRTFVRYSTEESLVNIAYEFTYTLIKNKHTDMKLKYIYFFIYTKYIYVSNAH